jgi:HK97 family phage portal protein
MIKGVLSRLKGRRESYAPPSILPAKGEIVARKDEPIINDGDRNLPSIRIIRGRDYYSRTNGGYANGLSFNWGDYDRQAREGYGRNSDVFACIDLIAKAAKQVKWWDDSNKQKTYSLAQRKRMASRLQHPLRLENYLKASAISRSKAERAQIIRESSNPVQSIELFERCGGAALIEAWATTILIGGNTFIEMEANAKYGLMLHFLKADRVSPKRKQQAKYDEEESALDHWIVGTIGGTPRPVQAADMVHSKLFNPFDSIMGMAPLEAAMLRVLTQNEGIESLRRSYQKGSSPGWIELATDSEWTDKQILDLQAAIKKARTQNEELVLQNAAFHEMSARPSEMAYGEQQELSKRDIASVYHVDPVLIGDTGSRTYATYKESRHGLYMEAVIPLLTQFRDDWNRTIGARLGSPLEFDKDSFDAISAAREESTDRVIKCFEKGVIDKNEARVDLHYDPIAGADGVFYAPATLVPMESPAEAEARRQSSVAARLAPPSDEEDDDGNEAEA